MKDGLRRPPPKGTPSRMNRFGGSSIPVGLVEDVCSGRIEEGLTDGKEAGRHPQKTPRRELSEGHDDLPRSNPRGEKGQLRFRNVRHIKRATPLSATGPLDPSPEVLYLGGTGFPSSTIWSPTLRQFESRPFAVGWNPISCAQNS